MATVKQEDRFRRRLLLVTGVIGVCFAVGWLLDWRHTGRDGVPVGDAGKVETGAATALEHVEGAAPGSERVDARGGTAPGPQAGDVDRSLRVTAFLGGVRHVRTRMEDLALAHADGVDFEAILAAVRGSGLTAEDVEACLRQGEPVVPPGKRPLLVLAMAFARGFDDSRARFLVDALAKSGASIERQGVSAATSETLATAHALRLRGRLADVWQTDLADRWLASLRQAGTTPVSNATACLLNMLCEAVPASTDGGNRIGLLAEALVERPLVMAGWQATALQFLLQQNEAATLSSMGAALGGTSSPLLAGMALLDRPHHLGLLQSAVEGDDFGAPLKAKTCYSAIGLLSAGSAEALSIAGKWLERRPRAADEMATLIDPLPVHVAMRCVANLAGREAAQFQKFAEAISERTEKRLEAIRLSPAQRRGIIATLDAMLQAADTSREGRAYCLRQMGRVGSASDRDRIARWGAAHGLQAEARAAIFALDERIRRGIE
jgi:hypothetical protein